MGLLPQRPERCVYTISPLALRNYCVVNFQSPISNHWILGIGYYDEAVVFGGLERTCLPSDRVDPALVLEARRRVELLYEVLQTSS